MKLQNGYLTRESGKWLGHFSRWSVDVATGKKIRKQKAFKIGPVAQFTKKEAHKVLRERLVKELGVTGDGRVTFKWFTEQRWMPLRESSWRPSTAATNKQLFAVLYKRFGDTAIEDMDPVEMQTWLNALAKERSGSQVKHCRIFLRSICAEAVEQDYLHKNPARMLRVPPTRATAKDFLSHAQIKALLKAARLFVTDRLIIRLLLATGMRPSELFALRWRCFNEDWSALILSETVYRGRLRGYTKTTAEGETEHVTVVIPKQLSADLADWWSKTEHNKPDDFIFPTGSGTFWLKENWQRRRLTPLAQSAGIEKCNYQTLRRTTATHAQKFGSLKDISTILRHRSTETAARNYVQSIDESVRKTVESLFENVVG
jgi:integrase